MASQPRRKRLSRADKSEATRQALFSAAARVVGEVGYGDASITRITNMARLGQGTFYNYFESRQDLFDQLLPGLGNQLLDFIRARVAGIGDDLLREEVGFRAFFEFLEETPEFYRILNEAEVFAPTAYRNHMRNMVGGYVRALRHGMGTAAVTGYEDTELDVIALMLLSSRNYLAMEFVSGNGGARRLPDRVAETYMKMVARGLNGGAARPTPSPRPIDSEDEAVGPAPLRHAVDARSDDELLIRLPAIQSGVEAGQDLPVAMVVKIATLARGLFANSKRFSPEEGGEPRDLSVTKGHPVGVNGLAVRAERALLDDGASLINIQIRDGDPGGALIARVQARYPGAPSTLEEE